MQIFNTHGVNGPCFPTSAAELGSPTISSRHTSLGNSFVFKFLNVLVNSQPIIEIFRPIIYSLKIPYLLELDSNYNANYRVYTVPNIDSLVIGITYPLRFLHRTAFEDLTNIMIRFVAVLVNDLSISLVLWSVWFTMYFFFGYITFVHYQFALSFVLLHFKITLIINVNQIIQTFHFFCCLKDSIKHNNIITFPSLNGCFVYTIFLHFSLYCIILNLIFVFYDSPSKHLCKQCKRAFSQWIY